MKFGPAVYSCLSGSGLNPYAGIPVGGTERQTLAYDWAIPESTTLTGIARA
jgi:hypothetical protein